MRTDFSDIYEQHRQGLFTLALAITRCPARAEDAVHDAFARLYRAGTRAPADPAAYVFAAVRNAAIDQVRRSPPSAAEERASLFALPQDDPAHQALAAERERSVARAMGTLPPDQREAVVLRVYGGLSFAQMAAVVNAPLATVAARYRRALERLKQRLENVA